MRQVYFLRLIVPLFLGDQGSGTRDQGLGAKPPLTRGGGPRSGGGVACRRVHVRNKAADSAAAWGQAALRLLLPNPDLPNAKPSPLWGEGVERSETDEGDVPTGRRFNIRIGGRYPPHPSSGFRETPDATFPPRWEGSVGSPSPIAYCLFAAYCLLPIARCLLPNLPVSDCRLPDADCL